MTSMLKPTARQSQQIGMLPEQMQKRENVGIDVPMQGPLRISVAVTSLQIPLGMMMSGGRPHQRQYQYTSDGEMRINIQSAGL